MKIFLITILTTFFICFSCQNDEKQLQSATKKDHKLQTIIFDNINNEWAFYDINLQPETELLVTNWVEWRLLLTELHQKPKTSIVAFQQKAKTLSKKVVDLNNNLPTALNLPAIKSRIAVLTTKIYELDLYLNLDKIPSQKVVKIIPEINSALLSLELQIEEVNQKQHIPLEQGESELRKIQDTTRAIPSIPTQNFLSH